MERLDRLTRGEHSTVSARVQVYAALREAIVRAELEPGRQLSENELAGRLGVSRTPVREALVRLRDERLVEIVPQLGTFVTRISARATPLTSTPSTCSTTRSITRCATSPSIGRCGRSPSARSRT
jgi:DNA-binding FadR family transcriptional regulator